MEHHTLGPNAPYFIILLCSNARGFYDRQRESAGAQWVTQTICDVSIVNPLRRITPQSALLYYFTLSYAR